MLSVLNKSHDQWIPCVFGTRTDATTLQTDGSSDAQEIFVVGRLLRYKAENDSSYSYGQVLSYNNGVVKIIGTDIPSNVYEMQYYVVLRGVVPAGGSSGQVLVKNSDTYGDAKWTDELNSWSTIECSTDPTVGTNMITYTTIPTNSSLFKTGAPMAFVVGGTTYYAKIYEIDNTTNYVVKYMGPLVSGTVTKVYIGKSHQLTQWSLNFNGAWADEATSTLIEANRKSYSSWGGPRSYVVGMQARCNVAYTSGGAINAIVNGQALFADPITPVVGSWTSAKQPNPTYYVMEANGSLEISTTAGTGDGSELSVDLWLVNEMGQ